MKQNLIDYPEKLREVSQQIKRIRLAKKLTVQEVAYRCDIERSNLSRIEAGRSNITLKTLCLICNALEVPLTEIIK